MNVLGIVCKLSLLQVSPLLTLMNVCKDYKNPTFILKAQIAILAALQHQVPKRCILTPGMYFINITFLN